MVSFTCGIRTRTRNLTFKHDSSHHRLAILNKFSYAASKHTQRRANAHTVLGGTDNAWAILCLGE